MDPDIPETEKETENTAKDEKTVVYYRNRIQAFLTHSSVKQWLLPIGIAAILLLIIVIFLFTFSNLLTTKSTPSQSTKQTTPSAHTKKTVQPTVAATPPSQTLVYGTWTSQSSVIRAVNTLTDKSATLATLPLNIKKVSILSPNTLFYIDQTDQNDHGKRVSGYNIQQKQFVINIPAANGFGIDNYIFSPNKRYVAFWEVKFSSQTQTLQGGQSRVYTVDLTRPAIVNLLYDEQITPTVPVHYPRAILDDGTIFTDQYIPNDPKGGTGWAYGMSRADFDGTNKLDITSMPNGTYGSQPTLSPDGKFLLFTGYDGSNGDGTTVKNGYRQAILTPNTVELLDTKTLQRYKLPNLPSTTYSSVQWDVQTGNVIITMLSPEAAQMGTYLYDLHALQAKQIALPQANGTPYSFVSQLTNHKTLVGIQSNDAANLGNLGETYAYAYTQFAILGENASLTYLSIDDPFAQYITMLPDNYFANVLGAQSSIQRLPTITPVQQNDKATGPQLYTFFLKTTLASLRMQGKNTPSCQNLGDERCAELGFTPNSTAFKICQNTERTNNQTANACF